MPAAAIDYRRVLLLVQQIMLTTSALTTKLDITRQHKPMGDGIAMPAVGVLGLTTIGQEHRRGGGLSGSESDSASATLAIGIRYSIDTPGQQQFGLEDAVSLLWKHLCERTIDNESAAVGTGGNAIAASGHIVEMQGYTLEQEISIEEPRQRGAMMSIDLRITRTGSNSLLCEA